MSCKDSKCAKISTVCLIYIGRFTAVQLISPVAQGRSITRRVMNNIVVLVGVTLVDKNDCIPVTKTEKIVTNDWKLPGEIASVF